MSAPVLIALAPGCRDPRPARTVRDIAAATKRLRPDLMVEVAFFDHVKPNVDTVVDRLMTKGHTEFVVVPLLLNSSYQALVDVPAAVQQAACTRPEIAIRVANVIGTGAGLLAILDDRLRAALKSARVRELDALVLAAAGSSDARANASVSRLARLWSAQHKLPTSVAFASAAPPSTGEAVRDWRRQGRRHVAVGSLFIAPGVLTDRASVLALEAGAVAVSAPLGAHSELGRLALARYSVSALDLVEIPV